jgi:hypothetical protein
MQNIIINQTNQGWSGSIVPYLPLNELQRRPQQAAGQPQPLQQRGATR